MRRNTRLKHYYIHWMNGAKETVLASSHSHAIRVANIKPNSIGQVDFITTTDVYTWDSINQTWVINPKV